MRRPTEQISREMKENGCFGRSIKKCSYVVTMCKRGGDDVVAVRMEYFQNKLDAVKEVEKKYPGWKIKTINKLYEEDFDD